jgi:hypothetical protein
MKPQTRSNWVVQRGLTLAMGILLAILPAPADAQAPVSSATSFGYTGQILNFPALQERCDFEFKLYDAPSGGNLVGGPVRHEDVPVTAGVYMVELDFGRDSLAGPARYLEIGARPGKSDGPYTLLPPRQKLLAAPYALSVPGLRTQPNPISPNVSGGYSGNSINAEVVGATIAGGGDASTPNRVTDDYGAVGGGVNNQAGDNAGSTRDNTFATVSGGFANIARAGYATVGGGWQNSAGGLYTTVGGGALNLAEGSYAVIAGGQDNSASGVVSTIAGGWLNSASNAYASVGGGYSNIASNAYTTVAGGSYNVASGERATVGGGYVNIANGKFAVIPGGRDNQAQGDYSFGAGRQAKANRAGCFVWADSTAADLNCDIDNRFMVRASGGVYLFTEPGLKAGTALPAGSGSWSTLSDRAAKANFVPVDGQDILARLADLPLQSWNYRTQAPSIRHIGPTSQDFYATFGVGEDKRYISTVDAAGVALAAIQGLQQLVQAQRGQLDTQQEQIAALQRQNADLTARLAALEELLQAEAP